MSSLDEIAGVAVVLLGGHAVVFPHSQRRAAAHDDNFATGVDVLRRSGPGHAEEENEEKSKSVHWKSAGGVSNDRRASLRRVPGIGKAVSGTKLGCRRVLRKFKDCSALGDSGIFTVPKSMCLCI